MRQERCRARAANLIIDHSGSGKPIGLGFRRLAGNYAISAPIRRTTGLFKAASPAIKRFYAAKTQSGRSFRAVTTIK
jgi:hypothetical protein